MIARHSSNHCSNDIARLLAKAGRDYSPKKLRCESPSGFECRAGISLSIARELATSPMRILAGGIEHATAASATFALKAELWLRRGRLFMVSPVRGDHRRLQAETPLIGLFKFAGPALTERNGDDRLYQSDLRYGDGRNMVAFGRALYFCNKHNDDRESKSLWNLFWTNRKRISVVHR
jgi:hypothetical protein